jgi:hypothetical protein
LARRQAPATVAVPKAQAAMWRKLARPTSAPVQKWTRTSLRRALAGLYQRMLPLVQKPLLDNYIKWSEALESWEPFRTRFVGRPTALFAGSILVALNAWATGVDAPLLDKRPTSHPFCIIVCGAHGTGKSAVLSFLLQEALAWGGWSEDDFCYTPDSRALQWL